MGFYEQTSTPLDTLSIVTTIYAQELSATPSQHKGSSQAAAELIHLIIPLQGGLKHTIPPFNLLKSHTETGEMKQHALNQHEQ